MEKSNKPEQKKNHSLCIENRASLNLSGINEVISSCETELCLVSSFGEMTITGKDFKIIKFNAEESVLIASGAVDSVKYKGAKVPLIKRIFK